jgi:hypothetical protein
MTQPVDEIGRRLVETVLDLVGRDRLFARQVLEAHGVDLNDLAFELYGTPRPGSGAKEEMSGRPIAAVYHPVSASNGNGKPPRRRPPAKRKPKAPAKKTANGLGEDLARTMARAAERNRARSAAKAVSNGHKRQFK